MSRTQLFVPFLAGLLLTGCSNWRDLMPVDAWREVDNQAPPAELTDIPNPIAITTRWSHGTGKGAGDQRVKLVPAIGAGRILTADSQGQVTAHDLQSEQPGRHGYQGSHHRGSRHRRRPSVAGLGRSRSDRLGPGHRQRELAQAGE